MADWSIPQINIDDNGDLSVDIVVDDNINVDVTNVDDPEVVQEVQDAVSDSVVLDVSGGDVISVTMSVEDFKKFVQEVSEDVLSNDLDLQEISSLSSNDIMPLAVDTSVNTFTPQAWQLNMAQNRPIGYHYVMSRLSSNNTQYVLILGRNITYSNGIYTYSDCDYYSVYNTTVSSSTRYNYDVRENASGSINSSSYVCYSDLFFDYVGGRSVSSSWLIIAFIVVILLFLIFFRGDRK